MYLNFIQKITTFQIPFCLDSKGKCKELRKLTFLNHVFFCINPFSANITKWSNTRKHTRQIADELFECV